MIRVKSVMRKMEDYILSNPKGGPLKENPSPSLEKILTQRGKWQEELQKKFFRETSESTGITISTFRDFLCLFSRQAVLPGGAS
jgi:hypothetical protein